jgi:hypothetical protein
MSMSTQDWRDMARVHRAGAQAYRESPHYDTRRHAASLQTQADECEAIATERETAAWKRVNPDISCSECHQMKPGPGAYLRTDIGGRRVCDDCATRRKA